MKRKNRKSLALLLSMLVGPALAPMATAQGTLPAITEQEAHAIGVDAYIYLYSLVTMDVTRKQLTNVEPGKGTLGGPMNAFANAQAFPAADFKAVIRPNFDTLYSSAYLGRRASVWLHRACRGIVFCRPARLDESLDLGTNGGDVA